MSSSSNLRVAAVAAPVRAQVLQNLREAILNRTFQPGQRLVERELCELTGVSRTTIREALRQLESEGLVRLLANQGPVVAKMSTEEAHDLYDVRGVLEALAASRFAATASDEEVQKLVATTDAIERTLSDGDLAELIARKDDFYSVLLDGARNAVVRSVLTSLWGRIAYLRATSLRRPKRSQETLKEVRAITDAIVRRDADAAWTLSRDHVKRAAAAALETLEEE
ncbi:MAG: GntR family transcriptional regulator [Streptosporangiales bacterium]